MLIFYKRLSTPSLLPADELPLSITSNPNNRAVETYANFKKISVFLSTRSKISKSNISLTHKRFRSMYHSPQRKARSVCCP